MDSLCGLAPIGNISHNNSSGGDVIVEIAVIIVSACAAVLSAIFAGVAVYQTKHKTDSQDSTVLATLLADVGYIKQTISEMRIEAKTASETSRNHEIRITKLEAKVYDEITH